MVASQKWPALRASLNPVSALYLDRAVSRRMVSYSEASFTLSPRFATTSGCSRVRWWCNLHPTLIGIVIVPTAHWIGCRTGIYSALLLPPLRVCHSRTVGPDSPMTLRTRTRNVQRVPPDRRPLQPLPSCQLDVRVLPLHSVPRHRSLMTRPLMRSPLRSLANSFAGCCV